MADVVASQQSLDERIGQLLPQAGAALGVELLRRQLLSEQASRPWYRISPIAAMQLGLRRARDDDACRNEGMICNFIGMTLQVFKGYGVQFLDFSISELQLAVERIPDYYQPHENLADTYVFKAKKLVAQGVPADNLEVVRNLRWGIEHYGRALEVLKGSPLHGKPEGDAVRRLLLIDQAVALMLEGPTKDLTGARAYLNQATEGWSASGETSARTLLNLAAACGRLLIADTRKPHQPPNPGLLRLGRGLLAHGLARDGARLYWAGINHDEDLLVVLQGLPLDQHKSALRSCKPCIHSCSRRVLESHEAALATANGRPYDLLHHVRSQSHAEASTGG